MNLIERVDGTQKTIDAFLDQDFKWGERDCGQLAGTHLEAFGTKTPLSQAGNYTTERGAKRVLVRLGVQSMEELVDGLGFERIAPASAIVGDIVAFPGGTEDAPWTALGVHCGTDRILGFADPEGTGTPRCVFGPVSVCTLAWRVA